MARIKLDAWLGSSYVKIKATELSPGKRIPGRKSGKKSPAVFRLRNYMATKAGESGRHGSHHVFAGYKGDLDGAGLARDVWQKLFAMDKPFCGWSQGRLASGAVVDDNMLMAVMDEDGEMFGVLIRGDETADFEMVLKNQDGLAPAGTAYVEIGGQGQ